MSQITTKEVSQILGISKRTLFRWEKEGRFKSTREGILNVRVYDRDYVVMAKKLLNSVKQIDEHNTKLREILAQSNKHQIEQVYYPGKRLKLISSSEMEASKQASDNEKTWSVERDKLKAEFGLLLQDFRIRFPDAPIKELLLKEERK